ncbi:hypothetical protein FPSE_06563 [Fusarium pseudograminearum CS3096]|uniref:Uncharacterized protein n=1 Tax=Fusarium pseudograminearum (strain CS3096) TaxID=1028729 RepID=K3VJC4_FUSPC|nr:hypothetical protein FPSE_06563 [Fusarium pseudograminearum CS3096]EKJ73298.1 hypothetical protein FPSE_06563 [Fusarium pseudograminearum CS3096]
MESLSYEYLKIYMLGHHLGTLYLKPEFSISFRFFQRNKQSML